MKITKRQLKRIIREERNKLLKEEWTEDHEMRGDQQIVFEQILEWMKSGITAEMLRAEIEDAEKEIAEIEESSSSTYELPPFDMIG